jgi:site-specific DNA recombinase
LAKVLKQAEKGRIDLILTKSVSRLARNTVDVLEATRMLKDKGVDMFFENENLKLSDQQTEFVLTVISAVAQEESRNISENIKWGYQRKFERGEIQTKYKNFMGYTEKNGELVIVPEEATIVKKIFELYAEGYSIRKICSYLEDNGIKTKTGKTKWAPNVIGKMLHNEKYKGCTLMQKTYSEDLLSGKRRKNHGEVKQYYYKDTHPAIVSKELYEKVQLRLNEKR